MAIKNWPRQKNYFKKCFFFTIINIFFELFLVSLVKFLEVKKKKVSRKNVLHRKETAAKGSLVLIFALVILNAPAVGRYVCK
jgi:hypothetical protein